MTDALIRVRGLRNCFGSQVVHEQLDLERNLMRELGQTDDYAKGVAAFLAKREPVFKGR